MNAFPSHNIDPRKKGRDWCLRFVKAAWNEGETHRHKMFYYNREQYARNTDYALSRQDPRQYRPALHIDEAGPHLTPINEKILPVVKERRRIALSKLQKSNYNIIATPIDALAKDEADDYLARIKAKMLVRKAVQQAVPDLAESPLLQPEAGEPLDMEELEMQVEYGFKHNMAIEAELGIQLVFHQNDITHLRHKVFEDLFDQGVAVLYEWMTPDGKIKIRRCNLNEIICAPFFEEDGSDIQWIGERRLIPWNDFVEETSFSEEEYKVIFEKCRQVSGNDHRAAYGRSVSAKFFVPVLDLKWYSTDIHFYERRTTGAGNTTFGRVRPYEKNLPEEEQARMWRRKLRKTPSLSDMKGDGQYQDKVQNIYQAKWVVDTDFIYDFGLMPYMKRDRRNLKKTALPYIVVANNFRDMTASGIMEDLIPIADAIQVAWLKLQNIRNELVPYVIDIDLDALEDVALSKGGDGGQMAPRDLIQMMFQKKIMVNRRRGVQNGGGQYKAIDIVTTNYGEALAQAWNDLTMNINLINEVTGFNELTDGSTPNPKTLTTPAQMAYEATNNALYGIQYCEKRMLLKLAEAVFCRLRRAIKMGKVEGWLPALGTNSMKFISVSPDIDLHDYGIMLEDRPTQEQKQALQQQMQKAMMEGTLEPQDLILIENTQNLKQAEQILAFRISKRKEQKQKEALMLQQQNGQIQIQSAQAAEAAKQSTLQLEYDLKLRNEIEIKKLDMQIKDMELRAKEKMNTDNNATKKAVQGSSAPPEAPDIETPLPSPDEQE